MFDVGFSELLLLAVIALVVLGPEKLPHAARMAGAWVGRIRRLLISVQADIENEVAAAEMRERIKKELEKAKAASGLDAIEGSASEIKAAMTDTESRIGSALRDAAPQQNDTTPPAEKP